MPLLLCRLGHVASTRQLLGAGATKRAISAASDAGLIRRVAVGSYACTHLDTQQQQALSAGCRIDCASALARNDVWAGIIPPAHLHLRARPHQQLLRVPPDAQLHWSATHGELSTDILCARTEVATLDALLQAAQCMDQNDFLASVESAVHLGFFPESELSELAALLPARLRPTLDRFDRGGQSGYETHTRVQLLDAGHRVRTQVPVPGTSPLDLLVDDCVGVETDGRRWHEDRFLADRTKDIITEGHGIRILRIAGTHIFESWPRTLATIERMIRDARCRGSEILANPRLQRPQ